MKLYPTNRRPIEEILFETQKDTKKIPGTAGIRTGICWIQVHRTTVAQTGGFNGSFICWYRVQEPLSMVTQTDVKKIFHILNQDTAKRLKYFLPKKYNTDLSHVSGHLYKSLPNIKSPLHLYIQFHIRHHMIFLPNCYQSKKVKTWRRTVALVNKAI